MNPGASSPQQRRTAQNAASLYVPQPRVLCWVWVTCPTGETSGRGTTQPDDRDPSVFTLCLTRDAQRAAVPAVGDWRVCCGVVPATTLPPVGGVYTGCCCPVGWMIPKWATSLPGRGPPIYADPRQTRKTAAATAVSMPLSFYL